MIPAPRVATALMKALWCVWIGLGATTAGAFSQVLVIPWGEGDSLAACRWQPGGRYGPSDFVIAAIGPEGGSGSFLYLLDREQERVQCFDLAAGTFVAASPAPPASERLAIRKGTGEEGLVVVVWDGTTLHSGPWGGPFRVLKHAGPVAGVKRLGWRGDQPMIVGYDGSSRLLAPTGPDSGGGSQPRVDRVGRSRLVLRRGSVELLWAELDLDIGTVQYLGEIAGRHLVLTEEILSHSPIMARELLLVLGAEGGPPRIVPIPFLYYTVFPERSRIVEDTLYVWISAPSGLHLLTADADEIAEDRLWFPVFPEEPYHYNFHHPPTPPTEWAGAASGPIADEEEISRWTIMAVADDYATVEWTASVANSTNNGNDPIYCPHGDHLIRTPEWVTPGPKVSMPYKWGGFTAVDTFVAGVPLGKYCGDNYCSRSYPYHVCYGDDYTLGVDCSGFVSRCWGTRSKYSTSTLGTISRPLDSFHDLLRGDCLNLAGSHVRLVAEDNPSGPVVIVESGAGWRVGYHSLTLTELSGYEPRRFLWVTEDGPALPQPRAPSGRQAP